MSSPTSPKSTVGKASGSLHLERPQHTTSAQLHALHAAITSRASHGGMQQGQAWLAAYNGAAGLQVEQCIPATERTGGRAPSAAAETARPTASGILGNVAFQGSAIQYLLMRHLCLLPAYVAFQGSAIQDLFQARHHSSCRPTWPESCREEQLWQAGTTAHSQHTVIWAALAQ